MSAPAASEEAGIRIRSVELLAQDGGVLRKTTFDYRRRDGSWETPTRETNGRGNAAAMLPRDPRHRDGSTGVLLQHLKLHGLPDP